MAWMTEPETQSELIDALREARRTNYPLCGTCQHFTNTSNNSRRGLWGQCDGEYAYGDTIPPKKMMNFEGYCGDCEQHINDGAVYVNATFGCVRHVPKRHSH